MSIYLDCNATTPPEPAVLKEVMVFMENDFGNAGSRTHEFGSRAKSAVQAARAQVASVVEAKIDEVIFTSGATESNNLAILGLLQHGEIIGKKHVISTAIEHKAVLEPLELLQLQGFSVTLLDPNPGGWIYPQAVKEAIRDDTVLVSMMQVNNETGVAQCVSEVTELLRDHPAFLHVDAAQGFGKDLGSLRDPRIDLISVSAHKIYGPKGIGALVARRRGFKRPPLTPLSYGGGQERGLRPGTLPVPLIVGLGKAAEMALEMADSRAKRCADFRNKAMEALSVLSPKIHGDETRMLPHVVNLSFPHLDSEAVMVALKGLVAVSNGSACTSASYQPSHVLKAMGLDDEETQGALRISWCHMTEDVDWESVVGAIKRLM